ncbi:MAG: selenocysteine-specific elongation factor [Chloroflexi bacterium]|jgi:selenocysteine-specific elongation factor|nr:MAG: selenocysteine-specific elongation factor [Chloroflexota bacterium]
MYVVGTAGHVDHGKSTLVKALTGIDPDRLQEEKQRGLTIDLGFAWLELPSGREISLVDVPGHERFIKNMLAGVGGIDLALLVVAADESVMPQTREHLAILDLLQVRRGLAVVTKQDLVDEEIRDLVKEEVADVLKGTALEGIPIVAVSAVTGEGIPELLKTLDDLLEETPPRTDRSRPRLPVDRSFTMTGFGAVVTGTLIDGSLSVGQEIEVVPKGLKGRVRGLQSHKKKVDTIQPGNRVAVNLSGVSHEELERGDVLALPRQLKPSTAIDVRLRVIPGAPYGVRHNVGVTFHTGSSESLARVRLLEREAVEPGEETWAQIKLEHPTAVLRGDFFVVRSADATLGGGTVTEPHAKRHRRFDAPTLRRLEVLSEGTPQDLIVQALEASQPGDLKALSAATNLALEDAQREIAGLLVDSSVVALGEGANAAYFTAPGWQSLKAKVDQALGEFHNQYPIRKGFPKEELRSRLGLTSPVFALALARLVAEGQVAEDGALVKLSSHEVQVKAEERQRMEQFVKELQVEPYAPAPQVTLDVDLLNLLIGEGRIVRVSDQVVFDSAAFKEMVDKVVQQTKEQGSITVAQVRDLLGTSRKYVLALMEYLDEQRITRRNGDERVLR